MAAALSATFWVSRSSIPTIESLMASPAAIPQNNPLGYLLTVPDNQMTILTAEQHSSPPLRPSNGPSQPWWLPPADAKSRQAICARRYQELGGRAVPHGDTPHPTWNPEWKQATKHGPFFLLNIVFCIQNFVLFLQTDYSGGRGLQIDLQNIVFFFFYKILSFFCKRIDPKDAVCKSICKILYFFTKYCPFFTKLSLWTFPVANPFADTSLWTFPVANPFADTSIAGLHSAGFRCRGLAWGHLRAMRGGQKRNSGRSNRGESPTEAPKRFIVVEWLEVAAWQTQPWGRVQQEALGE